ncbi:TerD family protein [Polymorphospora rubra]|uniref:TerD family protein n=1 Tax=Polymorphospora rubra TaxID=338584 RepID=UPI0033F4196E
MTNDTRYAVVDVETTGLHPERDRVLSVAVVQVDRHGAVSDSWSTLVDPGCDPGPVHIHGLTPQRLAGAPRYGEIAAQLDDLLDGRVFVAHNASFDWRFLALETGRLGRRLPSVSRLCTVTLSRRLGLDGLLPDLRLGTVAAHWGVPLVRAHDALEDATALAGVFRHSLAAAEADGVPLPLVACEQATPWIRTRPPRYEGGWLNPGRLDVGGNLVQGMRIAVTGATRLPREEIYRRCHDAGLDVKNTVGRRSSVLVCNDPDRSTTKTAQARGYGVPVIDEATLLTLLAAVKPGEPAPVRVARGRTPAPPAAVTPADGAPPTAAVVPAVAAARVRRRPDGPLAGRRILVLGGPHPVAARARQDITSLGGSAAVNLTARVTDVVCLPGAETEPRMTRVRRLEIPVHTLAELPAIGRVAEPAEEPVTLSRGGVVDLPGDADGEPWTITAAWSWHDAAGEVDVAAFLLDEYDRVRGDEDFVFYNQPAGGGVELGIDGGAEQSIRIDLADLPGWCVRVRVVAALTGDATFGAVGPVQVQAVPRVGQPFARATLDVATTERTMLLADVYRRGSSWRLRAVGQGYDHGLAWLATTYGVRVDD